MLLHLPRIPQLVGAKDHQGLGKVEGAVGRWLAGVVVGEALGRVGRRNGLSGSGRVGTDNLWG